MTQEQTTLNQTQLRILPAMSMETTPRAPITGDDSSSYSVAAREFKEAVARTQEAFANGTHYYTPPPTWWQRFKLFLKVGSHE